MTDSVSLTCALAALPPDLREAFLLVKAEGLTSREAAQVLDIPQGTVQWQVHQASRRLRALLTEGEETTMTCDQTQPLLEAFADGELGGGRPGASAATLPAALPARRNWPNYSTSPPASALGGT